jgi:hypothetical protein
VRGIPQNRIVAAGYPVEWRAKRGQKNSAAQNQATREK